MLRPTLNLLVRYKGKPVCWLHTKHNTLDILCNSCKYTYRAEFWLSAYISYPHDIPDC